MEEQFIEQEQLCKVIRSDRVEESGQMKQFKLQSFCIIFESEPVWLLTLKPQFTKSIYVLGCTSFSNFNCYLQQHKIEPALYYIAMTSLVLSSFHFSSPPNNVTYLLSGSVAILNEQSKRIVTKTAAYITDRHTLFRRALPTTKFTWKRLTHAEVGSATNFTGAYSYETKAINPQRSNLRRRVGDFLYYSIPPASSVHASSYVPHTSLLPIHHLTRNIHYPTHFSHNSFGYRPLTSTELINIFNLPPSNINHGPTRITPPVS